jgi:O-antigen/teichoic acid export membrane protein
MLEEVEPLTDTEIARVASRGAVSYLSRASLTLVLQTVSSLLIAHHIDPRDYGLFGLALTLTGAIRYVGDFGVTFRFAVSATLDREDYRRGLALGLATATLGALLVSVLWQELPAVQSGPSGARFLGPALGLVLVITAPIGPLAALLERRLAFGKVGAVGVLATLVSSAVLIPLLLVGLGIWALVLAQVVGSATGLAFALLFAWRAVDRLPTPTLRGPIVPLIRASVPFQAPLMAQAVVGVAFPLIVASVLGARGLGFVMWSTILATPFLTLIFALQPVIAPSLARMLRDDGSRYDDAARTVLLTLVVLSVVGCGAVVGLVPAIIRFIFGARWLPAKDAVELALLGIVPSSLVVGCASIIGSRNQPGKALRASLAAGAAAVALTVPAAVLGGVPGAACVAYVVAPLIELAVLAKLAAVPLGVVGIHGARILLPLAALSFVVGRHVTSPGTLAAGSALMGCAGIAFLAVCERELIRVLWRRIRPNAAVDS